MTSTTPERSLKIDDYSRKEYQLFGLQAELCFSCWCLILQLITTQLYQVSKVRVPFSFGSSCHPHTRTTDRDPGFKLSTSVMWCCCWWFYSQWHIDWTMPLGADPGGYQVVHIWYPSSCCKKKGSEVAQAQVQPFIISTEGQGPSSQAPAVAAILVASHCHIESFNCGTCAI
jgi:hypothetical protein